MDDAARSSRPRGPGRPKDPARQLRRREEILRCALRHFARAGFEQVVLDDVAADLSCAKGTLYNYFPTKQSLFTAAADMVMRELLTHTRSFTSQDPLERIAHAVRAYLSFFDAHPEYVELIIQERARFHERPRSTYFQYRNVNAGVWRELLEGLMREGRVRTMPADRAFEVIGDLLYGTIFTNHMSGRRRSLSDQAEGVLDILFYGLLTRAAPNPARAGARRTKARTRSRAGATARGGHRGA
ncbi:MAG: TetR/AcrR family transcriptional regulator [Phycisphaerales bacterium]|nr:TetR/AcrR family transcriptional regulator [Phycisphaerales bacterium]